MQQRGRILHCNIALSAKSGRDSAPLGRLRLASRSPREENVRRPVSRVLYRLRGDDHSSRPSVAERLQQPTRAAARKLACGAEPRSRSYSALLPVGFAVPRLLPAARCALTAPFHPCPPPESGKAVCFLLHFPWGRPRRALPGTVLPWSPDFPLPAPCDPGSGHPAV
jgi:hypothetical protein